MKLIKISLIALSVPFMMVSCDDKKEEEKEEEETSENAPATVIEQEVVTPVTTPEDDKIKLNVDSENGKVGFENDKVDVDLNLPGNDNKK